MNFNKPIAVTLASAVAVNCVGAAFGIQLFADVPPLAAVITASSSFTGATYAPIYNTVTDERIEMPAPLRDRAAQS